MNTQQPCILCLALLSVLIPLNLKLKLKQSCKKTEDEKQNITDRIFHYTNITLMSSFLPLTF